MQQGASETEALHGARGKRADLTVQSFFEVKLLGETGDALRGGGVRKMVEPPEETQIFAAGKPRIEAEVAASMVAELAANGSRF